MTFRHDKRIGGKYFHSYEIYRDHICTIKKIIYSNFVDNIIEVKLRLL